MLAARGAGSRPADRGPVCASSCRFERQCTLHPERPRASGNDPDQSGDRTPGEVDAGLLVKGACRWPVRRCGAALDGFVSRFRRAGCRLSAQSMAFTRAWCSTNATPGRDPVPDAGARFRAFGFADGFPGPASAAGITLTRCLGTEPAGLWTGCGSARVYALRHAGLVRAWTSLHRTRHTLRPGSVPSSA